jgi:hypothetical protein
MKSNTIAAVVLLLSPVICAGGLPVHPWDIETTSTRPVQREIVRGESIHLQPRYLNSGTAMDLTDVYEVAIRYRSADMATNSYYIAYGNVHDATAGVVRITWTPTNEPPASICQYTITAASTNGLLMRGFGTLRFIGSIQGDPTNMVPAVAETFDWSLITEHLNTDRAPFADPGDLLEIDNRLDGHDTDIATLTDAVGSGSAVVISNLNEHIAGQIVRDAGQDDAIAEAAAAANMGGDVQGKSTNAIVKGIQNIPVAELFPDAADDGYALKYNHATGELLLGPVATAGTAISNIVVLSSTASATDVPASSIGTYRTIRPGNLPSSVINVGGFEIAWFDLLGITMRAGTLNLLNSWLTVNTKAYDGTVSAPSRSYAAQPDMGTHRFSTGTGYAEGFAVSSNRVWYWDSTGIHLEPGKTINHTETDPLSIQASSTYVAWTNAGGTHATNAVAATSPLLTNGLVSVTWTATGPMSVRAETSSNQVDWITAAATADPVYLRITVANDPPVPGEPDTAVSNIVATSWTRPDLFGQSRDTAGQVFAVDAPATVRAAANKAYVDSAVAAVDPADWADYPASAPIRANGHPILLGGGWTMVEESGFGVVSFDLHAGTNAVTLANNGVAAITAYSGLSGLRIDYFSIDSATGTVGVATNGAVSAPLVQWSSDLVIPSWTSFEPLGTSYPAITTNGWYEYSVELPDVPNGTPVFIRAVCQSGAARVDVHSPLYIDDQPVLTGFVHQGTNLLYVADGVTNRIVMEAYSE